jgi:MFS family permease
MSDAHHLRKLIAGTCMVLAPIAFLAGTIVQPALHLDEADQIASAAANLDAWYIAQLMFLVAIVLFVPVVLGFMHMLRERGAAAGHVGGGLALIGLVASAGITAFGMAVWQMAQPGAARDEMVALLNRIDETTGIWIPFFLGGFAFPLGLIVLAVGLASIRAVSPVIAGAIAIGAVALAVGFAAAVNWLLIVAAAFLVVGIGSTGLYVLRETDADWEHTPTFRGFRPAAGTS